MSKDLKDLIDSVDSVNQTHIDLETIIRNLKEDIQRLNFTISEQRNLIQEQNAKLSRVSTNEESLVPDDIQILKDMVINQRQDIIKKDKDIEILKQTLEDITTEYETTKGFDENENEELVYANKVIVQLTEENEIQRIKIEDLKEKVKDLQSESDPSEKLDLEDKNQDLIDAKRLIFQLTEENGLNRVQIESLRTEVENLQSTLEDLITVRNQFSNELESANRKNDELSLENEKLQAKIKDLPGKPEISRFEEAESLQTEHIGKIEALESEIAEIEVENATLKEIINANKAAIENLIEKNKQLEQSIANDTEKSKDLLRLIADKDEKLGNISTKLEKLEAANKQLSDLIVELKSQEKFVEETQEVREIIPVPTTLPKIIPHHSLFHKMYNLLEPFSQLQIIEYLIQNLESPNRDEKTNAIKILSTIRGPKVFEALKSLLDDKDWIVKLYLIKALAKFNQIEVKELMEQLQNDKDNDVREAATDMLMRLNDART